MLLFILIIIAIYIIAFKNNNQKEITYNIHPIVSKEKFAPVNYYHPNLKKIRQVLPNGSNLVQLIISEYVDPTYKFNDPNLPVTFRYPKSNRKKIDKKYTKLIKQNIESWNLLFSKYFQSDEQFLFVKNINLISVQETEVEFILSANVMLTYLSKTLITGRTLPFSSKKSRVERPPIVAGSHQKIPTPRLSGVLRTNLLTSSRNSFCPSGVSGKGARLSLYSVGEEQ